ncbi:hypothetical protein QVD17_28239 [Tagetes erecta]|uniref:Uncharacterized protein n=1 Tax=Tagetes erecta TaxID=13708 RepID=A0AAD8KEP9_TARER|nr:hypothetical protein QVD17_28239 [Tagetes erecta]
MASLPIRYGGSAAVAGDRLFNDHLVSGSNNLHSFSSDSVKAFVNTVPIETLIEEEEYDLSNDNIGMLEKIDEWMKTSLTKILKNMRPRIGRMLVRRDQFHGILEVFIKNYYFNIPT